VQGPCEHEFCLPCVERLLLSPRPPSLPSHGDENVVIATPTLGSCPMCREDLYLFDLRFRQSGELVHSKETGSLPRELAGSIFVESTEHSSGVIGRGSYHFPASWTVGDSESTDTTPSVPYYNMTNIPRNSGNNNENDDVTTSKKIYLFENYHWHTASRTFAGVLPLTDSKIFKEHFVVLSFSPDWRFVRQGVVQIRRRHFDSVEDFQSVYSFDGRWKLVDCSVGSGPFYPERILTVEGFCLKETMRTPRPYFIRPRDEKDDSSSPRLVGFTEDFVLQGTQSLSDKQGTPIGGTITWLSPDDHSRRLVWRRESVITEIPPDQTQSVGGNSGRLLLRSTQNEGDRFLREQRREEPQYNKHTIWGNVFCQGLQVGLASYHFGAEEAYISYENPATGMWPPLDNGQPIPSRVPFRNVSFDDRTFRGDICWLEDFGTTWQNMAKWTYEMNFDSDYLCIVSGGVQSFSAHDPENGHEMSRYGESLNYCNAKLWGVYREEVRSLSRNDDRMEEAVSTSHYRERSLSLRFALQTQGASVRTIALMHRVLTIAQDPESDNPINYNL